MADDASTVPVTVLVPGVLRAECGGESTLTLRSGPTLGALLDQLGATHPRLHRRIRSERSEIRRYVNVYVDGEDCRLTGVLTTPLRAGAEVQILPSVAGG
ncbi:molybdopterin converting factor small subunit [Nakamurella sp. UYEF19]|uniref:MoaD/ThiS family protein n=1 Tax=Nakamurella sp. UYEF19 TaxID=1756392 RepID=UPI003394FC05